MQVKGKSPTKPLRRAGSTVLYINHDQNSPYFVDDRNKPILFKAIKIAENPILFFIDAN